MKFSSRQEVAAPQAVVFRALTDFDRFERLARERGVEVSRTGSVTEPGPGMAFSVKGHYRGRQRSLRSEISTFAPDEVLGLDAETSGLLCHARVDLAEMARRRTRIIVGLDLRPATFRGRVLLQSLKLGKSALARRFDTRVAQLARLLESRCAEINDAADRPDRRPEASTRS